MLDYKDFISLSMEKISKAGVVLDVGGGKRFQKWLAPYESLFKNCEYKTFDYDATTGADVVGDIHAIPLPDESVDAVICSSVLEHVKDPIKAVSEMHRILKSGGLIYIYVPSIYPYHASKGHYSDYWRFFDDTVELLLKDFKSREIVKYGGYFMALSFFIPWQNKFRKPLNSFAGFFDWLLKTENKTTTAGYFILAEK